MSIDKYEVCYVAYIDILGFKNKVNNSVNNVKSLKEVIELQTYLTTIHCNKGISKKVTYNISDSFFFVFPIIGNSITSVFWEIADIQAHIIDKGFLVRGAITIGETMYNEKILFGPSVNEVVALEEKIEYPCIVLSNNLFMNYFKNIDKSSFIFEKIEDELNDVFMYLSNDVEKKWISHINKQASIIDKKYTARKLLSMIEDGKKNDNERIKQKYIWLEKMYLNEIKEILNK